jgi:hypothetical protein
MRAAKILTLNKQDIHDVSNVISTAQGYLNATQIRKLMQNYSPKDIDAPVSGTFLHILIERSKLTEETDDVLISLDPEPSYEPPALRTVHVVETYIPSVIHMPKLTLVVDIPTMQGDEVQA